MRRDALESRADRGMRAYVTMAVTTRAKRMRARFGLTPHRVGERKARSTRAARRSRRSTHRQ